MKRPNVGRNCTASEARLMAAMLREGSKSKARNDEFETAIDMRDSAKVWTSIARNCAKSGRR
jgi:hypothetical protein